MTETTCIHSLTFYTSLSVSHPLIICERVLLIRFAPSSSIAVDPGAWGYQPLYRDMEMYKPLIDSPDEPFTLHLIGGEGHLDIPKALSNVVIVHDGLDYLYFYAFMQSMDVILPAFANNDCKEACSSSLSNGLIHSPCRLQLFGDFDDGDGRTV